MNSLSYISRRLDVLVAPAPKPADAAPPPDDTRTGHAWLAHAVDAVVPDARAPPMRRVASSPAGLNLLLSLPSLRPTVTSAPRAVSAPVPVDPATSVLRRVFFVRVLVLVWKGLWDTWAAWSGQPAPALPAPTKPTSPDTGGESTDEKESEDEDSEKLSLLSRTPPPAPAILLTPPAIVTHEKPPRTRAPAIERTTSAPSPPATLPPARKLPPFHQPKTLVLDLDETLIHSTTRPMAHLAYAGSGLLGLIGLGSKNKGSGLVVEVVLNGRSTVYHVYKRPFVDYFLRKVRSLSAYMLCLRVLTRPAARSRAGTRW
jgi:CTD nuclear envelope phosphatase 1